MIHFRIVLKPLIPLVLISQFALFAGTGLITTVAGTGSAGSAGTGGPATSAQLNMPVGLCYNPAGDLFIADYTNSRVVRVDAVTGILTVFAGTGTYASTGDGGPAALAAVNGPLGLAMDSGGNLYISEINGHRIRKVDTQTGIITTVAGTGSTVSSGDFGPAYQAGIPSPVGLAFDASGNLYLAEYGHNVRRIDSVTGIITTVLANGPGGVSNPSWLAFDSSGKLLISDSGYHEILRLNVTTRTFDVFAGHLAATFDGDGIPAVNSSVGARPIGIAVDPAGNVYLASPDQYRIRRVDAVTGLISTVAGNGSPQSSGPDGVPANNVGINPQALAIAPNGSLILSDSALNISMVRRISLPSPWTYTATSLVFNLSAAGPGQTVTFTATPVPLGGGGTPTGTVTFMDPTSRQVLGTAGLSAGTATLTVPAPTSAGTYHLVASYSGDSIFAASVSPDPVLTIPTGPPATTLSLTSSANPATFGDQVSYAAMITISGTSAFTPTGTMQVRDAGALVLTVPGTGTGVSFSLPLAAGTHPLTVTYSGDNNLLGSTSPVLNQVILAGPVVTIASSVNPATIGAPLTLTATVTPAAATGVVEFVEYVAPAVMSWGTANLVNGTATLTFSALPAGAGAGTHSIQAEYHGDTHYNGSNSAPLSLQVLRLQSTISLSSTMNPGVTGTQFSINATVAAAPGSTGQPGGTVQLFDGGTSLGTASLTNGAVQFPVTFTTTGTHPLTGVYSGDAIFAGSTSTPLSEVVKTTTAFYLLSTNPSPSVVGTPVTFGASLTQTSATGTVEFVDSLATPPVSIGIATVVNGAVSLTTSSLAAGTHTINIVYSGDANFMGATASLSQVVKVGSTIALTAAPASAVFGQAVQMTANVTPAAATGSVQFFDGATILGTVAVSNGTAVLSVPSFSAGTHSIGAAYLGDTTYAGANSATVVVTVTKATPSISVTSSQNPAPGGQAVTFTIALTPATTTGSVQLLDGSTVVANLSVGVTTASVTLAAGTHSVTAVYSGDANFNGATSTAVSQVITTSTTTTLSADLPNSTYGQTVRFTAAVAPAPTGGTVQFLDGSTMLGTVAVQSGAASLSISTFTVGTHSITAVYSGDGAVYVGSTSAVFTETVGKAATTSTLAASPNPVTAGQSVTLTAAVTPSTATGTMQFLDGATVLGTVPVSNGAASLSTSALAPGSHSITVAYSGDATNSPSTSAAVSETVNKAATTTTLAASPNPATVGQSVTLSAAVSPSTATGTMQFLDGATILGAVAVSNGVATLSTSALAAGSHSLTVTYSGDAANSPSTSAAVTETVNKATTTTTLAASPNPATVGQSVTLTAAVTPSTATGTVQFLDGATILGTSAVSSGVATLFTSALAAGSHSLTVAYSGDATYSPSTSAAVSETVNKAATIATLTSSLNPAVSGQAVTFTAHVSPIAATGNIQFKDGTSLLGTVALSGGSAALTVSSLTVGAHSITAIYIGDANYTGNTSSALAQTVTAAIPGAPTTLTATATSSSQINLAWTASPTGGVTYNVYSSTTSGFTPSAGNRIATGITATTYSHTGLAPSTAHYYLVTAQNSAGESASSNQAGATTLASGVACQVVYTVTTQWNVGFGTAITIKNTGSTAINGWNLTWKWAGNQQITQAWNSSYTQNGKNASLTNLSWNPTIAPGATLSGMGFNGSYSGTNAAPTAFYVNGTLCQ